MHFDYDVYEKIHVDFFYNHCKVNNFFLHVLNHVLKKFVINFTINCFNEVNNKCNMKFIHKNNLFSFDLYGVRKIAPRSWSGFGLRLALELGLGGAIFLVGNFPKTDLYCSTIILARHKTFIEIYVALHFVICCFFQ